MRDSVTGLARRAVVIEAPENLGLSRTMEGVERGCDRLPDALRSEGVFQRLGVDDIRRLPRPAHPRAPRYDGGVLNGRVYRSFLSKLSVVVGGVLEAGGFPIVVGGDCGLLIGCSLALARRGRFGLAFLDAHLDFVHPGNAPRGVAAGMELALVTGRGTGLLADMDGRRPYFRDDAVAPIGFRSNAADDAALEAEVRSTSMTAVGMSQLRGRPLGVALAPVLERLTQRETPGFWIHVDADVLDASIMPAVDCPEVGGLQAEELARILRALLATRRAVGMNVGILDPTLDADGSAVRLFARVLEDALRPTFCADPSVHGDRARPRVESIK